MTTSTGILIGGVSQRMGKPKALLTIEGITLIERTVAVAVSVTDHVVLLGEPQFDLPSSCTSLPILEDRHPGIGPIAGLESLLHVHPDSPCILLACDMPFLTAESLRRLLDTPANHDAAVSHTKAGKSDQMHPCCALYRPSALPAVRAAIADQQFGMMKLLASLRVWPIQLTGGQARWVENWNEPIDVRRQTARTDARRG